jgi:hypothetical protein
VKRSLAAWAALAAVTLSGCSKSPGSRGDLWVDAHPYDTAACPTGDDAQGCSGVLASGATANPGAGEFLVLWQARYRPGPQTSLYARRVSARTGKAIGPPVLVTRFGGEAVSFFAAIDVATRQYVLATQEKPVDGPSPAPVVIRRLTATLQPTGRVRQAGRWLLTDMVARPDGRFTLVGLEGPPAPGLPPRGRLRLRITTFNHAGDALAVARVPARPSEEGTLLARGVYDPRRGRVLVVWQPGAPDEPQFRLEQVRAPRGSEDAAASAHTETAVELTCNSGRGDCLIAYPGFRMPEGLPLQGRLIRGRAIEPAFQLARNTGGLVGAAPAGDGYAVTWVGRGRGGPQTKTIFDGETSGAPASVAKRFRVAGPASVAGDPASGARLIVWNASSVYTSMRLMARLLR